MDVFTVTSHTWRGYSLCTALGACITSWDSWLRSHFINQKGGHMLQYKACMQTFTTRMNYLTWLSFSSNSRRCSQLYTPYVPLSLTNFLVGSKSLVGYQYFSNYISSCTFVCDQILEVNGCVTSCTNSYMHVRICNCIDLLFVEHWASEYSKGTVVYPGRETSPVHQAQRWNPVDDHACCWSLLNSIILQGPTMLSE